MGPATALRESIEIYYLVHNDYEEDIKLTREPHIYVEEGRQCILKAKKLLKLAI